MAYKCILLFFFQNFWFSFRVAPLRKVSINEKTLFIHRYENYIINLSPTFWARRCRFNPPEELEFSQFIGKKLSKNQINLKKLGVTPQRKNLTNEKILSKRYLNTLFKS